MKTWRVEFTDGTSAKFECDWASLVDGYWQFREKNGDIVAYVPEVQVKYLELDADPAEGPPCQSK